MDFPQRYVCIAIVNLNGARNGLVIGNMLSTAPSAVNRGNKEFLHSWNQGVGKDLPSQS